MFDYIDTRIHIDADDMTCYGCPEACAFCEYIKHIKHKNENSEWVCCGQEYSHWVCYGQKDMPTIEDPIRTACIHFKPKYTVELKEKEPTEENKMDSNVTKDIKVTHTVFNRDFWIPEDIYVLENIQAKKRFVCVLMNFEDNDLKIRVWINSQGYAVLGTDQLNKTFRVVKHITQKSLVED